MNYANPLAWYIQDQARRQKNRIDNQKIMFRQLFDRAVQMGLIELSDGDILVKAEPGRVVGHFNHHPDLFQTIPFNATYLTAHKDALERTLNQAWQYVNSPTRITDLPHI